MLFCCFILPLHWARSPHTLAFPQIPPQKPAFPTIFEGIIIWTLFSHSKKSRLDKALSNFIIIFHSFIFYQTFSWPQPTTPRTADFVAPHTAGVMKVTWSPWAWTPGWSNNHNRSIADNPNPPWSVASRCTRHLRLHYVTMQVTLPGEIWQRARLCIELLLLVIKPAGEIYPFCPKAPHPVPHFPGVLLV